MALTLEDAVTTQSASFAGPKLIVIYNDFVARVALEVVDSSWCKQQLRVKSADSRTTALSSNEGASGQPLFTFASFCVNLSIQSEPFYFSLSKSSRHDSEKLRKGSIAFAVIIGRRSANVIFGSEYERTISCATFSASSITFGDDSERILLIKA
jgi:hypothetical protein